MCPEAGRSHHRCAATCPIRHRASRNHPRPHPLPSAWAKPLQRRWHACGLRADRPAAREAAILGYRAVAVSQYIAKDQQVDWAITGHHAQGVLQLLFARELGSGYFWNVNLPHPLRMDAEIAYQFCGLDIHPHKYVFRQTGAELFYEGTIHERPRDPGTDVAVCFDEGKIAITRIGVGTTDRHPDARSP